MRFIRFRFQKPQSQTESYLAIARATDERVCISIRPNSDDGSTSKMYLAPYDAVEMAKQILAAAKTATARTQKNIDKLTPKRAKAQKEQSK